MSARRFVLVGDDNRGLLVDVDPHDDQARAMLDELTARTPGGRLIPVDRSLSITRLEGGS